MYVLTVIYWLSTRVILSSQPFTSLTVYLFPTQITCVKARHSLTLSLPLKFLFISRIYNLCLLAHIPVGVHMAVRAQRTQFELCKRKRPHLYYFVERHSQILYSAKEGNPICYLRFRLKGILCPQIKTFVYQLLNPCQVRVFRPNLLHI